MSDPQLQSPDPWRPVPSIARKFEALFPRRPALGAWAVLPHLVAAEILASSGFDFLMIDLEHGPAGEETALAQIVAAERWGAVPILRVAEARDPWIKKALDIGAAAIMVPSIHTVALAEQAAAALRYGPEGRRGVAARVVRAARYGADEDYESRWNDQAFLIAQIESPEGLANAEAIAATPGVDALFFGPSDYAAAAGYPGGAEVIAAYRRMLAIAHGAGRYAGTTPFADQSAAALLAGGADFAMAASDISLLRRGAEAALAAARSGL